MPYSEQRNASFDFVRLLAVIGIIWFHAKAPGALLGYSGLSFFVLLIVVFAMPQIVQVRQHPHRAPALLRYAATRAERLLVPWITVSIFFGSLKVIEILNGSPVSAEFSAEMWITGTALHLWFLPFAFIVSIALWPLGRWVRLVPPHQWVWLSLFFAGAALGTHAFAQEAQLSVPFAQWAYAGPCVLLGVAFALCRENTSLTVAILGIFAFAALGMDLTMGLLEITIASLCLIGCMTWPNRPSSFSSWCARASFWIYLIHPGIMTVFVRGFGIGEGTVGLAAATTIASIAIVALWETSVATRFPARTLFS